MKKSLYVAFGLPGCGKTTVAKMLAEALGTQNCVRISPDAIRKELFPVPQYTKEASWRIWEEAVSRAKAAMERNEDIVWDAVFGHSRKRREILETASEYGYECVFVRVSCDNEISVEKRLKERTDDPSDADFEVYRKLKTSFQTPVGEAVVEIDNSGNMEDLRACVFDKLTRFIINR